MMDILRYVLGISKEMKYKEKTLKDAAIKLGEETGEVMGVISVLTGLSSHKTIDNLDLSKELADVFLNIVDIGYLNYGERFLEMFEKSIIEKSKKRQDNYSK